MAENINLPDDILFEIFTRIATKTVGKCKCISKAWQARLSTPSFIKLCLTRKPCQENLLLISTSGVLGISKVPAMNNLNVASRKLALQTDDRDRVIGSCNGLVLLLCKNKQMCLFNSVTFHQVTITKSYLTPNFPVTLSSYGFGYDTCSDDFKIVVLYSIRDRMTVDVYSLKTRLWKKLINFLVHYNVYNHVSRGTPRPFLNGAIHWLVSDYRSQIELGSVIVAFDLANETLHKIPTPPSTLTSGGLYVANGHLLMVRMLHSTVLDIWMNKEYEGSADSWTFSRVRVTNHVSYKLCGSSHEMPLCFVGKEEVVFSNGYAGSLAVYNITDGTVRHIVDHGAIARATCLDGGDRIADGCVFVESLVSPKHISTSSERKNHGSESANQQ